MFLKAFYISPAADSSTPFRLIWEAFTHAAVTARRIFVHIIH